MNKIFLSLASMIFAGFLMKSYKKLHDKPESKEEVYRRMKAEYDRRRAEARPVIAKLDAISTPMDGTKLMASMGTISDLEAALKQHRPPDQCDGACKVYPSFPEWGWPCNASTMAPGRFC